MELDAPAEPLQLEALGAAPSSLTAGKEGGSLPKEREPDRFYCPYPGCNRSFAELWRLKVHFRAPPDIRGSGKERGHGTELTHCPKCGKTLKPGKHHVGCSGSKANARQASKRSRPAGDADTPDEALASSPQPKHAKAGELDVEPLANAWQEFARAQGAHTIASMALQPPLKQEHQEWAPSMQPGMLYGHNGTTAACWLPGHVNGFVPQLQPQSYPQAQFPSEVQFQAGYAQQVPAYPSLPAYSQPGMPLAEAGQLLPMPPGGSIQHLPQPTGVPGMPGAVLYHQQPHDTPLLPPVQLDGQHAASSAHPQSSNVHSAPETSQQQQQQPAQPPNGSVPHGDGHQLEGRLGDGGGSGAGGGNGAGSSGDVTPSAPADAGGDSLPPLHPPPKPTTSHDSDGLGSVFGDVEEFTRDFGRIPSPPPLPADFHSASSGTGAGVLFNFAQFGQKLPRSSSQSKLNQNLYGLGLDPGIDGGDLLYDHSDDGDLMQLLFGVPDELPTMATIHLHKWGNGEDEGGGEQAPPPSPPPLPAPSRPAGPTSGAEPTTAAGSGSDDGGGQEGSAARAERSGGQASTSVAGAQQQPQQQPNGTHRPGMNGKLEVLGGSDASAVDALLGHAAARGGGKAQLGLLVNGISSAHHGADEHHRDHLLDAETFRLLHSCD